MEGEPMKRSIGILATALVALVVAAAAPGCGDDDEDTTEPAAGSAAPGGETAAKPSGKPVTISETEYKLTPSDPTVSAGKVSFEVSNDGGVTHALEVEGPSGEVETEDLAPGDSETLEVDLSKPGAYEMYCPIANHKELGMEGEVTVR
jgi:uncharacterized cupredoxin-like copper-binding protein